jgi:hypothetical protein
VTTVTLGSRLFFILLQINLNAKQPPNFLILLRKTSGDGCVDRVEHIFCGASRQFFVFEFKNMTGKGTITILGGAKKFNQETSKIQKQ